MDIPECFRTMAYAFHQDFDIDYKSLEDLYVAAVRIVPRDRHAALAAYLDQILAEGPDALGKAWAESGADFGFKKISDLAMVLGEIRARL